MVSKANSTKSHVISTSSNAIQEVNDGGNVISNEKIVTLLGITVDNKLSFETHLNKIHKNTA